MAFKPSQSNTNRSTYIPPRVEQAMAQHMQQSMPANLRQYVDPKNPTYIPRGMEQTIVNQMQKSMPAHLKQYAGAYVEQKVIQPGLVRPNVTNQAPPRPSFSPPPVPSTLRRDHAMPVGEQHTVELNTLPLASKSLFSADQPPAPTQAALPNQPSQPTQPLQPFNPSLNSQQQPLITASPYDFITDPNIPKKSAPSLPGIPGLGSGLGRAIAVLALLLVLMIIFAVAKSALSGSSNGPALLAVSQDQVEILHITTNALQESDLSSSNQPLTSTIKVVLSSNNYQLSAYLSRIGDKFSQAQMNLKVSTLTDQTLKTAESSGDFNPTFDQTLATQLKAYMTDMNTAYGLTSGVNGKAMLKTDFADAKLILNQVSAINNSQS